MEAIIKELANGGAFAVVLGAVVFFMWKAWWPWFCQRVEAQDAREEARRKEEAARLERLEERHERQTKTQADVHRQAWRDETARQTKMQEDHSASMTRITQHLGKIHDRQEEHGEKLERHEDKLGEILDEVRKNGNGST